MNGAPKSNVLTSGSSVANPKSDPDYSVFIMKIYIYIYLSYVPPKMSSRTPGVRVPQVEYHCSKAVLSELFSAATQFLERRSIATHIALLDKKKVILKRKNIMYGVYYVPYFLPFSNFVLFFHFPISYDF
jgi:hypothetical protein